MQSVYENYIRARFTAAKLTQEPFPHLVIRDVLPPDLYRQMEVDCPSALEATAASIKVEMIRPRKLGGLPVPMVSRNREPMFALRPGNPTTAPLGRYARRWQAKYRPYIDLIDRLTLETYRTVADRLMDELTRAGFLSGRQDPTIGQGIFSHHTQSWRIPPHVHDAGQIVQSMIYFPLPGSVEQQGTLLYRLKRPKRVQAADLMQTYVFADDEVEAADMMPYLPNTLASFLNTPLAIHASPETDGREARRYTFTAIVVEGARAPDREIDLTAEFGAVFEDRTAA